MLLRRLYRIFQRYADIHVSFDLPTPPSLKGKIAFNPIAVRGNRMWITGQAQADKVSLQINRTTREITPRAESKQLDRAVFSMDIPLEIGDITVTASQRQQSIELLVPGVTALSLHMARCATALSFVRQLVLLLPQIYRWKRQGDLVAREQIKQRLGLVPCTKALPLDGKLLLPTPASAPERTKTATLIMPVFNAFELLPEALSRIARHSGPDWRLVLIEDCSTDPRVRSWLQAWAQDPAHVDHVDLVCNEVNLGFVGSVNCGFDLAHQWPDDPVVLVNSDVNVPQGWLPRLLGPLSDPSVASVTPMSNDAEIFTVPAICQRNPLPSGAVDVLDAQAATFDAETAQTEAPTGIGYCMALAPQFLKQVPNFDPVFGRGYGEETDWCQKTRLLGGRHLAIGTLFVEHQGGTSFGSADKQRLLEKNLARITRRYPSYDTQVQDFIRTDPLISPRLALSLVWVGTQQDTPVPVYLAHSMGGGAEVYLQRIIAEELAAKNAVVVLRAGQLSEWQIEVHTAFGLTQGRLEDTQAMVALMGLLTNCRIIYSCGVGAQDTLGLPNVLLTLAQDGARQIEVLVHDFFMISPSYTLLGKEGWYHGVPVAHGALAEDSAHQAFSSMTDTPALAQWQEAWGRLITASDQITVFCETGRDILMQVYPQVADKCRVVPHQLPSLPPVIAPPSHKQSPIIGVLGNIGVHKGAAVVCQLSQDMARAGAGRVVVIGQLDPNHSLSNPSEVHGSYMPNDLPGLVARYGVSCWLIPSIWPETFSFTTHEALSTGLPVFAFDLGAQGRAVSHAVTQGARGGVLPLPTQGKLDTAQLIALVRQQI